MLRFPTPPEALAGAGCLSCSGALSLSQPDLDSPERLLGVCGRCSGWFLIDLILDLGEGIISGLPDMQVIREALRQRPGEGISVISHEPGAGSAPWPRHDDGHGIPP